MALFYIDLPRLNIQIPYIKVILNLLNKYNQCRFMTSAIEQRIVTFLLKQIEGIKLIYLFGSHSKGTANKNSDIDIAIMSPQPLDNVLRFNIAQQLAIELDSDIDLVDLNSASTVLQM